jgi:hypothetical protein
MALALHRDAFYDVAAADLALLQEVVRALARRLRALVSERPGEARVESEGVESPGAMTTPASPEPAPPQDPLPELTPGAALAAAALGQPEPAGPPARTVVTSAIPSPQAERESDPADAPSTLT